MTARTSMAGNLWRLSARRKAPLRRLLPALAWVFLLAPPGWAQSDSESATDSSESSEDLSSFSVSGGTPGSWIQAAIARHQAFIAARVNAARNGETPGVWWGSSTSSDTTSADSAVTSTDDASSSLSDLSTLLGEYSDSLDSLGSLSSLLSWLTGTSTSETTDADTSKSSSRQQSEGSSGSADETAGSDGGTSSSAGLGGAIARLPTVSELYPSSSTTGDEREFSVRLAYSLMEAFLDALSLEFQSTEFVDLLKTLLEPLIVPAVQDTSDEAAAGDGTTEFTDGV